MANALHLEIVTPEKLEISTEVDDVTAPGTEGEFGVLPGHTPFLTTLATGELSYKKEGKTTYYAVGSGFFEVLYDRIKVLAESIEEASQIDIERAERAKLNAEEKLKKLTPEDKEFALFEAALKRALLRLHVAAKRG